MKLTPVDWAVISGYFLFNLAIRFYYRSRAQYQRVFPFPAATRLGGSGTSMVATTFAADTPLAVTGMVARNGIAGNWLWWNAVASGLRPGRDAS